MLVNLVLEVCALLRVHKGHGQGNPHIRRPARCALSRGAAVGAHASAASAGVNPISANTLPLLFSKEFLVMFNPPHLTPVRAVSVCDLRPASAGRADFCRVPAPAPQGPPNQRKALPPVPSLTPESDRCAAFTVGSAWRGTQPAGNFKPVPATILEHRLPL